jgi:hypothetical protein
MVEMQRWWRLTGMAVGLLLLLAVPGSASGTHRGQGVVDELALNVSYRVASQPGVANQLVAQVRVDDGSPVVGIDVEFLREVEFLGTRRIALGRATTDAGGTAQIPFNAAAQRMSILVRFPGNDHYHAAELAAEIVVPPGAVAPGDGPIAEEGASLAIITAVMPPVLAMVAGGTWLLLLGLAVVTALAIRRGRSSVGEANR